MATEYIVKKHNNQGILGGIIPVSEIHLTISDEIMQAISSKYRIVQNDSGMLASMMRPSYTLEKIN